MGLVEIMYCKPDNGTPDWSVWDGKVRHKWLYSAGPAYVRTVKGKRGTWSIQYRLGKSGLVMPDLFKAKYKTEDEVCQGIKEFGKWAFRMRSKLIEAHERSCDSINE